GCRAVQLVARAARRSRAGAVVNRLDGGASGGTDGVDGTAGMLGGVCVDAAGTLDACGVGVSVMTAGGVHGMAAASDPDTARIEELQFTFGEGPCIDAFTASRPVLMSDLDGAASARWPMYTPAVTGAGVRAVFAFPLQIGAARLGVLDVFRNRPGPLTR